MFAREVKKRTLRDRRVLELDQQLAAASGADKVRLRARREEVYAAVHSEKLGEVADEFDTIHSVHRAQRVGAVHQIVAPGALRPYLVGAIERGIRRVMDRAGGA